MKSEIPSKLKKLNQLSRSLETDLEESGVRVTALAHAVHVNQFFQNNIPNIVGACQGLLRGEANERHILRLEKSFISVFSNLEKIKDIPQTKKYLKEIGEIENILNELKQIYHKL